GRTRGAAMSARGRRAGLAALALGLMVLASRARLTAPAPTLLLRDAHGRFLTEVPDARDPDVRYLPLARLPPPVLADTPAVADPPTARAANGRSRSRN